jgi:hypothetical protein
LLRIQITSLPPSKGLRAQSPNMLSGEIHPPIKNANRAPKCLKVANKEIFMIS